MTDSGCSSVFWLRYVIGCSTRFQQSANDSATAAQVEYLDSLLECVDRIHTEYRASLEG